jgi:uridine phosphorylase
MIASMNLQRSDTEQVVVYKSRDSFLQEVVAARGKLIEHKKDALRALVAAGVMTEAEAAAAATTTEVHVDDQRANRAEALPDIPPIK